MDFRAEGRRDTPGHVAQWVLFATVECPVAWKTGDGFPARARTRDVDSVSLDDDDDDEDDTDVDSRDVRVAGCRAVAVVLRGSRERRREVATMMLNPETPKFVPKRLREAFDELPRALVSPPAHLLGFDSEPDPFAGVAPQSASSLESDSSSPTLERIMSVHPSVLASASTPAAYLGPDGALCPRAFFRVTQDGAREGAVAFEDAAQWRFSSPIVAKWARTIAVEERRQALDIRRYDLHDAVFAFAGRTPRALPGQHYDTYALDVPGLLEAYPPVAPLDVLKLRLTRTGGGRDELSLGSRYFGAVAGKARAGAAANRAGSRGPTLTSTWTDHRCVVRRGGGRGKPARRVAWFLRRRRRGRFSRERHERRGVGRGRALGRRNRGVRHGVPRGPPEGAGAGGVPAVRLAHAARRPASRHPRARAIRAGRQRV